MSTWFDKNFKILHMQNFLIMVVLIIFIAMWECKIPYFLAQLTTGTGPLKKNALKWGSFLQKEEKKVILFISVWPMYIYWEKIAKEKSLFMYNRLRFAAKEANLCIHKSKHQKKGENLPAARPKARYFVPKIILINCEKDLFLWSKKIESGLKFVWDTYLCRIIYSNSAEKGFLIQNIYF